MPMAKTLGMMLTYLLWLLPMKSHDHIITFYIPYHKVYGYQTWEEGDLLWEPSNHKVTQSFKHVMMWDHVINQKYYVYTSTMSMPTKPGRVVIRNKELLSIRSRDSLITWYYKVRWATKYSNYISTTTMTTATRLARVVMYGEELSFIRSQDHLNTWSCKDTLHIKYVISLIPQNGELL